jgi:flavin-binding protein dodecin
MCLAGVLLTQEEDATPTSVETAAEALSSERDSAEHLDWAERVVEQEKPRARKRGKVELSSFS